MDPLQQPGQVAPPPMSPPEVGGIPGGAPMNEEEGFIGPEHFRELQVLSDKVREKFGEYQSQRFVGENQSESRKAALIKDFLLYLKEQGVDVSDQAAVAEYVEGMREVNPDMAEMFEWFIAQLFGEEPEAEEAEQEEAEVNEVMGEGMEEGPMEEPMESPEEGVEAGMPADYENLSQNVRERIQE